MISVLPRVLTSTTTSHFNISTQKPFPLVGKGFFCYVASLLANRRRISLKTLASSLRGRCTITVVYNIRILRPKRVSAAAYAARIAQKISPD